MLAEPAAAARADQRRVAILTDPGGPVLEAGILAADQIAVLVAILTDPGGPVLGPLCLGAALWLNVAILTDPGGPVLGAAGCFAAAAAAMLLRSSPTPGGRCWAGWVVQLRPDKAVAILTDPGGPVLVPRCRWSRDRQRGLRSSPTPGGRCWPADLRRPARATPSCDPHRPRGAGAGCGIGGLIVPRAQGCDPHRPRGAGAGTGVRHGKTPRLRRLRSSPTPGGRCWVA